ncbi:Cullin repeat-like-containing domain protein [Favolaschia claudopus]|uniref:Cullin repeat-like-containing domain protein n=1 Tax=Favolaschia claudopus TaxID=2862362 RepID=A0AAW0EE73_9AGAR
MEQKSWKADLEPTITRMLTEGGPLTFVEYTSAYAAIYNHITKSDGSSGWTAQDRQAELYARVESLVDNYTKEIGSAAPSDIEDVVPYYDSEWDRFSCGADAVDRVFTYLNRFHDRHVRRGQDTIRNLLFQSWKENVFKPLTARIEGADNPDTAHIEHIRNLLASNKLSVKKFKEMRLVIGVALPAE